MKKQQPHEGLIRRPGPGEQDIPDPSPDVEGHSLGDDLRKPIDQNIPGTPGSDGLVGLPGTGGEFKNDLGPDTV
jgi:hypothetical protein